MLDGRTEGIVFNVVRETPCDGAVSPCRTDNRVFSSLPARCPSFSHRRAVGIDAVPMRARTVSLSTKVAEIAIPSDARRLTCHALPGVGPAAPLQLPGTSEAPRYN